MSFRTTMHPYFLIRSTVLATGSLAIALASGAQAPPPAANKASSPPPAVTTTDGTASQPRNNMTDDRFNPRNFMLITELDSKGNRRTISGNPSTACTSQKTTVPHLSAAPEIDVNSQLLIQYDRDLIKSWEGESKDFEASISISGQVKSGDASREIEIPGYSLVGKEKSTASVRFRSASILIPSITQVIATAVTIGSAVSGIETTPRVPAKPCKEQPTALDTLRTIARGPDPTDKEVGLLVASIRQYSVDLSVALAKLADKANGPVLRAMLVSLNDLRPEKGTSGDADDLVAQASAALDAVKRLGEAKAPFTNKDNGEDARTVARALVRFAWLDDANCQFPPKDKDLFSATEARLLQALKDTSLVISQTGAKPGDLLVLTITNNADDTDSIRQFAVPIRIEEFGWNSGVSDSALLIRRLNVTQADNQRRIDTATAQVATTQKQIQLTLADSVNFAPAPGVTWEYTLTTRSHDFWRALQPGFGVNVSFPQFTETTTTISPGNPPSVVGSQSKKVFDVSAGPALTLFNGSLQFSFGWDLNADQKRAYVAVGFGFVKVIEKLKSLSSQ